MASSFGLSASSLASLPSFALSAAFENKVIEELHSVLQSYETPTETPTIDGNQDDAADKKKMMKTLTVEHIKPLIMNEINSNPDLYHEKDVLRIQTDDHFIQRYINEYASNPYLDGDKRFEDKKMSITDKVIRTLKWRQEFGINDLNGNMFPKEFFQLKVLGFAEIKIDGNKDKDIGNIDGNHNQCINGDMGPRRIITYIHGRRAQKFEGLQEHIIKFGCYMFEQLTNTFGDNLVITGFTDTTGTSIKQVDLKMSRISTPILLRHFPGYGDHIYLYHEKYGSIPWFFKPIYLLAMKFVPRKYQNRFTIINKETIHDLMPPNLVPSFMGGPVVPDYGTPTDGCITIEELHQQLGLSDEIFEKNMKIFNQIQERISKDERKSFSFSELN